MLKEAKQQNPTDRFPDGLILIGWMLLIPISAIMFFSPLGSIVLGPSIEVEGELHYIMTTYISYPDFQIYVIIIAIGSIFLGISFFGFFLRFQKIIFSIAALTAFLDAVLNMRCALFPDWRLPESGYTRENIDNFELFLILTLLSTIIPMFIYCLSLFKTKGRTRNLAFMIFPVVLLSGCVFVGLILVLFQNLANPQLFVGFEILRIFSIMSLTYTFALVSYLRHFSWIFKRSLGRL